VWQTIIVAKSGKTGAVPAIFGNHNNSLKLPAMETATLAIWKWTLARVLNFIPT